VGSEMCIRDRKGITVLILNNGFHVWRVIKHELHKVRVNPEPFGNQKAIVNIAYKGAAIEPICNGSGVFAKTINAIGNNLNRNIFVPLDCHYITNGL
jgi:hypothetical protein